MIDRETQNQWTQTECVKSEMQRQQPQAVTEETQKICIWEDFSELLTALDTQRLQRAVTPAADVAPQLQEILELIDVDLVDAQDEDPFLAVIEDREIKFRMPALGTASRRVC